MGPGLVSPHVAHDSTGSHTADLAGCISTAKGNPLPVTRKLTVDAPLTALPSITGTPRPARDCQWYWPVLQWHRSCSIVKSPNRTAKPLHTPYLQALAASSICHEAHGFPLLGLTLCDCRLLSYTWSNVINSN